MTLHVHCGSLTFAKPQTDKWQNINAVPHELREKHASNVILKLLYHAEYKMDTDCKLRNTCRQNFNALFICNLKLPSINQNGINNDLHLEGSFYIHSRCIFYLSSSFFSYWCFLLISPQYNDCVKHSIHFIMTTDPDTLYSPIDITSVYRNLPQKSTILSIKASKRDCRTKNRSATCES